LSADLDGNFERLMLAFQDRLYGLALRLSGNAQDAEEIVQDAFVHAYQALGTYDAERVQGLALRPWLYRITLNVFRNRVRGRRVATVPLAGESDDLPELEPAGDPQDEPETALARSERRSELAELVARLPERYRAAVVLRHVEGLSYAEMADILGQPAGTVKANVHRGLRWLRERVASASDAREDYA